MAKIKIDVTTMQEWEMMVRDLTDTGFSRQRAEAIVTAQLELALA